jgi:hypothetical protein
MAAAQSFTDDVLKALVDCREANDALDAEYEKKKEQLTIPFREDLEKLLVERQPLVDKLNWAQILDSADAPTKQFLNGTTDTKLLRAIESFKMVTSVRDGILFRRVVLKLRTNMFVETTELFREVDPEGKTTAISGVVWKAGTEKSRTDSLFRFFEEQAKENGLLLDALPAFEMVFQSPYLFAPQK